VTLGIVVALPAIVGACASASGGDKAGGRAELETHTIEMQAPNAGDQTTKYFAREVSHRSGGRLRLSVENAYPADVLTNEAQLARDVVSGEVDLAVVPARAWQARGVRTFMPLQTPLLITGYPLLRAVLMSSTAPDALRGIDRIGVVGLTLLPDEMVRPIGLKPLLSPASYAGRRIRISPSGLSADTVRALHALPVTDVQDDQLAVRMGEGRLEGVAGTSFAALLNRYYAGARYLTSNVTLSPGLNTVVMNRVAFDRLTDDERSDLRAAAAATLANAVSTKGQEESELRQLCGEGMKLVTAKPRDLAGLRRAIKPVVGALEREPQAKAVIDEIERLGRDPQLAPVAQPAGCPPSSAPLPGGERAGSLPNGTYTTTLTERDLLDGGVDRESAGSHAVTYTMVLKDGRSTEYQDPVSPDNCSKAKPCRASYSGRGSRLTFFYCLGVNCSGDRETVTWSFYRGRLTFSIVRVPDAVARVLYTAHPWRKVR
jgi:TRAP-type C4-dicarboxylate transport system substrate-binding protein